VTAVAVGLILVLGACSNQPAETTSSAPIVTMTTVATSTSTSAPSAPTTTTTTTTIPLEDIVIGVATVDDGFDNPVLVVADPLGGPDFVVQQTGTIVRADGGSHAAALDATGDVRFGGEQGLLGLAFHPEFVENRLAYISYTRTGPESVIEQFQVEEGVFLVETRKEILTIPQPASNHNGGMIVFGPDGYLWLGLGDGGASDDKFGHGQRADTLLGSMLRIAVGVDGVDTYGVPDTNPFSSTDGWLPEVWAIGLRNPWRFAIDGADLWIADVGQGSIEEVNLVATDDAGINFGWSVKEGSSCFNAGACDSEGLVAPIAEYSHSEGCSVTGGVVYRGDAIPSLRGQFFYSDYCSGILRSVDAAGRQFDWTDMVGNLDGPTGFGIGGDGEVYIVLQGGQLLTIVTEGN